MSDFFLAYHATLDFEGLYSCDPQDSGGETWKGISRRNWPMWQGWKIVDEVKRNTTPGQLNMALNVDEELDEMVCKFYQEVFWNNLSLDAIDEQEIAVEIFDTAVNQGLNTGARFFQHALNLLNNNGRYYGELEPDGDIGSDTVQAYNAYMLTKNIPGRSRERNIRTLLKVMNWLQLQKYIEICESRPDQEVYLYGWINRT
jgi:lysozyme family protein